MMVVWPAPNITMMTGTSAESGADRNRLTQGRNTRSAMIERPIATPSGTPMHDGDEVADDEGLAGDPQGIAEGGVGTISMIRCEDGRKRRDDEGRAGAPDDLPEHRPDDERGHDGQAEFADGHGLALNPDSA